MYLSTVVVVRRTVGSLLTACTNSLGTARLASKWQSSSMLKQSRDRV